MNRLFVFIGFLFILLGCKKPENRTCWKGSGKSVSQHIDLEHLNFKGFSIYNDINVNLILDSVNFFQITSYNNKVNQLTYEVVDSLLEIRDKSKCDFLRNNEKETTIDIHYTKLSVLSLNGNGKISSSSPISNEILHIYSHSSNGEIDLEVNAASFIVKFVNGTLNGNIKGSANNANLFHFGYSNVNFEELIVDNLRVTNKSDANLYVSSTSSLSVELLSLGNIYYKGNPTTEIVINTMDSKLINNN